MTADLRTATNARCRVHADRRNHPDFVAIFRRRWRPCSTNLGIRGLPVSPITTSPSIGIAFGQCKLRPVSRGCGCLRAAGWNGRVTDTSVAAGGISVSELTARHDGPRTDWTTRMTSRLHKNRRASDHLTEEPVANLTVGADPIQCTSKQLAPMPGGSTGRWAAMAGMGSRCSASAMPESGRIDRRVRAVEFGPARAWCR